jgi:hypothetical protein
VTGPRAEVEARDEAIGLDRALAGERRLGLARVVPRFLRKERAEAREGREALRCRSDRRGDGGRARRRETRRERERRFGARGRDAKEERPSEDELVRGLAERLRRRDLVGEEAEHVGEGRVQVGDDRRRAGGEGGASLRAKGERDARPGADRPDVGGDAAEDVASRARVVVEVTHLEDEEIRVRRGGEDRAEPRIEDVARRGLGLSRVLGDGDPRERHRHSGAPPLRARRRERSLHAPGDLRIPFVSRQELDEQPGSVGGGGDLRKGVLGSLRG